MCWRGSEDVNLLGKLAAKSQRVKEEISCDTLGGSKGIGGCTHVIVLDASLYKALVIWIASLELEITSCDGGIERDELQWESGAALFFGKIQTIEC